jgi:metal-sulfur cluster biosynthetic enzyme
MIGRAQVLSALDAVIDPELDEPITTLGFVGSCVVSASGDVDVHLRLPTSQCAPNFAYLMVADARDAVAALPEAGAVRVVLDEHYTGAEINGAVAAGTGFAGVFPGEDAGELDALRELFQRKALLARQGRVCQALLDAGLSAAGIVAMRVADLAPEDHEARRCLQLRRVLGLPSAPDAPALIAGDGSAIAADGLRLWLRRARLVGLSLESNGGICRSLLRVRYGVEDPTEERAFA